MAFIGHTQKGIPYGDIFVRKEYVLERAKFGVKCYVNNDMLDMYRLRVDYCDYGKELALSLERDIASRVAEDKTVSVTAAIDVPASLWDYIKAKYKHYFPKWFINSYPPKFETITKTESKVFRIKEYYPAIHIPKYQEKMFITVEELQG